MKINLYIQAKSETHPSGGKNYPIQADITEDSNFEVRARYGWHPGGSQNPLLFLRIEQETDRNPATGEYKLRKCSIGFTADDLAAILNVALAKEFIEPADSEEIDKLRSTLKDASRLLRKLPTKKVRPGKGSAPIPREPFRKKARRKLPPRQIP